MSRKRKFLSVAMWLLVSTAGSVLAAVPANQRWAIVATDGVRERGVVDLLTAQLSQVGGIDLVERDAIQRVLDELKLNAGGLVDRTKAVQFGRLLAADALLCVQENKAAGNSLASLRLVETRTGVRLCELLTSFGDQPDQLAATWLEEWRRAKTVLELPSDSRRYVGVIGIQSEEPGSALTSLGPVVGIPGARSGAVARRGCVGTGTPPPAASRTAVDGRRTRTSQFGLADRGRTPPQRGGQRLPGYRQASVARGSSPAGIRADIAEPRPVRDPARGRPESRGKLESDGHGGCTHRSAHRGGGVRSATRVVSKHRTQGGSGPHGRRGGSSRTLARQPAGRPSHPRRVSGTARQPREGGFSCRAADS